MKSKLWDLHCCDVLIATLVISGCKSEKDVAAAEAPQRPSGFRSDVTFSRSIIRMYPIGTATEYQAPSQLSVTGTVIPDIARNVPVISLASGALWTSALALRHSKEGQLCCAFAATHSGGFDAYRKAISDELLARKQLIERRCCTSMGP